MNNRRIAIIWGIVLAVFILFFGWLIVRAGEPISDTIPAPKAKREKKITSYDPIHQKMAEQKIMLDSLIMNKKKRQIKIDTNGISN